jgi:hypothetical protein
MNEVLVIIAASLLLFAMSCAPLIFTTIALR